MINANNLHPKPTYANIKVQEDSGWTNIRVLVDQMTSVKWERESTNNDINVVIKLKIYVSNYVR